MAKPRWAKFEDRVREVASLIYNRPCTPQKVGGVDVDGVVTLETDYRCLIEITEERTLGKVREDIVKLQTARNAEQARGVYCRCFCVVNGSVTTSMIDAGMPHHIRVLSVDDFTKLFFDFPAYRVARMQSPFGSAIDPLTGEADNTAYISVQYVIEGRSTELTSNDVADFLRSGRKIILLGEYGSGKSRCIQEVFEKLSGDTSDSFAHPVAIDLRKCWGLGRGVELLRRHFSDLGLDNSENAAVRAFNSGSVVVLLDGFDEIGSQAWSNDSQRLRAIRAKSLEGVKDLIQNNKNGVLIAGREHYFSSSEEMYFALGLEKDKSVVIRSKDEFNEIELEEYFQVKNIHVDLPEWLPRRPLICNTISNLPDTDLEGMFGAEGDEITFWNHFIEVLCRRDAEIHVSFDPVTIQRIFLYLARLTRSKSSNVGPITLAELQAAFEAATGTTPVEEASVMLQRLPSLGRVGPDSNDRRFVDVYILDGLRGRDVSQMCRLDEVEFLKSAAASWSNPLDDLGQRVLSSDKKTSNATKLQRVVSATSAGNKILSSDLVASLLRKSSESNNVDFNHISVSNGEFLHLALNEVHSKNLTISDSFIGALVLPALPSEGLLIKGCQALKVVGISSGAALPSFISDLSVEEFESIASVSRIRRTSLRPEHKILVTIIRKTFFQKGSGRKEEALLRGLGNVGAKGLSQKILNLLIREGVLSTFKGDDGLVYTPTRSETGRMKTLLDNLAASDDPLWHQVADL